MKDEGILLNVLKVSSPNEKFGGSLENGPMARLMDVKIFKSKKGVVGDICYELQENCNIKINLI